MCKLPRLCAMFDSKNQNLDVISTPRIFISQLEEFSRKKKGCALENNYGCNQVTMKTYLISGHTLLKLQL